MSDPIVVFAHVVAKPGQGAAVRAALERCQAPTRDEPGCEIYDLHAGTENPDDFMMYEVWQSQAFLDAHNRSNHLDILHQTIADKLASPPQVMISTRVA